MSKPKDEPACCPLDGKPDARRRRFLQTVSVGLGAACGAAVVVPTAGFVLAPLFRKPETRFVNVFDHLNYKPGKELASGPRPPIGANDLTVGETRLVMFDDPSPLPWAGITAHSGAWLRREAAESFTAFSVNCTHLGCPVRWMEDAQFFMCPCHGGVYYRDGAVAAGPPPHPLPRYETRVETGLVQILAGPIVWTTIPYDAKPPGGKT